MYLLDTLWHVLTVPIDISPDTCLDMMAAALSFMPRGGIECLRDAMTLCGDLRVNALLSKQGATP